MSGDVKRFTRSEDAKKAGWFSRRHRTSEAHDAAKTARIAKREARERRERASRVVK